MSVIDAAGEDLAAAANDGVWRPPAGQTLALDSGAQIAGLEIAYQTYGSLNADRSNAILVCHALTGDQHVAGRTRSAASPAGGAR
jgi:homoserine O-acetyltransferase